MDYPHLDKVVLAKYLILSVRILIMVVEVQEDMQKMLNELVEMEVVAMVGLI